MADLWVGNASFTLSNNNLTASATALNSIDTILGTISHQTGKYYFELTVGGSTGEDLYYGLAELGYTDVIGRHAGSLGLHNNGSWFFNNSFTASGLGSVGSGTVLGFAVDLTNGLIWVCNASSAPTTFYGNGGTGNPVTETNGFSYTAFGARVYLAFTSNQNGSADSATMSGGAGTGETTFTGTAPTGYTAWGIPDVASNFRASQVVSEVLNSIQSLSGTNMRASQIVAEVPLGPSLTANMRASQVVLEVLGWLSAQSCGPIPVFPTLPVGFPLKWKLGFKTTIGTSSCGREVRFPNQSLGLHEFELLFEELRDQTQNQAVYQPLAGFTQYMQLCQFWLMMNGPFGLFYFDAPWDDSRSAQAIGTGDGATTEFLIYRTFGSGSFLAEPVGGINVMSSVAINGVVQSPTSYQILGNVLVFNTPPGTGLPITATFSFFYLCHFIEDKQDFEEFAKDRWTVKSLRFRSVYRTLAEL